MDPTPDEYVAAHPHTAKRDLDRLTRLACWSADHDTGGVVPLEIVTALVGDRRVIARLYAAGLLHRHLTRPAVIIDTYVAWANPLGGML